MMDHSGKRAKCHAGASRLQRRVRRHRFDGNAMPAYLLIHKGRVRPVNAHRTA